MRSTASIAHHLHPTARDVVHRMRHAEVAEREEVRLP
jgi:hypothetical protein